MTESWTCIPRVFPYLRPYWRLASGSVGITLSSALTSLLAPWPLKILVDNVLAGQPLSPTMAAVLGPFAGDRVRLLLFAVLAGLGLALIENGLSVLESYVNTKLDQRMVLDFRSDMFQHAQRLSLAFHDRSRTGELMYSINNQASAVGGITMTFPPLAQSALTLVGMFWIAYRIDATLALLSLSVVPCLYYSVGYYTTHIERRIRQVKGMEGESLTIVHEAMAMLRVIVAFGREQHEYRRFRIQGESAVDARVKLTLRQTLFSLVVNMTTAVGSAVVLGFGAYQALRGRLTVGQLLVVMAYIASVYKPLEAISSTVGSLQEKLISLQMAFDLLDTEPEVKERPGAIRIERVHGHLRFEEVSFRYAQRKSTLEDVSFEVHPGQVVAIVGPTGAGKSTLVSLIPRFYDPQKGRILLDDQDVRDLTLKSLRRQISIVLQEPLLFSGTIAENIQYGSLDAEAGELIAAAKAANAHDFIEALPKKYDTAIGERGAQLSGGERQRIAVARAFLKDAPILILDEPTSSIDSKTEAVILDALERLMAGRTTFLIAHRLSTIRHSDLILVLNHGRVLEQGTHEELLDREGLYKQLHDMQMARVRSTKRQLLRPS